MTADADEHYTAHEAKVAAKTEHLRSEEVAALEARLNGDVSLMDQAHAASHEVGLLFLATQASRGRSDKIEDYPKGVFDPRARDNPETLARMQVTLARIMVALETRPTDMSECRHLSRNPAQPTQVLLALSVAACPKCANQLSDKVAANPKALEPDSDRCDWCGARGIDWFTPVSMWMGLMVAVGDACNHCAERLQKLIPVANQG